MKKIVLILIFCFGILLPLIGRADSSGNILKVPQEEIKISLEISSKEIQLGENFKIILNITKQGRLVQLDPPTIPGIENFEINGSSQSSSITNINNFFEVKTRFIFNAIPLKEGLFELGPVEINMGGKVYKSSNVSIKVNSGALNNLGISPNQEKKDTQIIPNIDFSSNKQIEFYPLQKIIYIFGIVLILCIIGVYFYIGNTNKDKVNKSLKTEKKIQLSIYDDLFEEKCFKIIQNYFEEKYNVCTKNLTFQELILYEEDNSKKEILEKIFDFLSEKLYAGSEIDREKLLKLVESLNELKIENHK